MRKKIGKSLLICLLFGNVARAQEPSGGGLLKALGELGCGLLIAIPATEGAGNVCAIAILGGNACTAASPTCGTILDPTMPGSAPGTPCTGSPSCAVPSGVAPDDGSWGSGPGNHSSQDPGLDMFAPPMEDARHVDRSVPVSVKTTTEVTARLRDAFCKYVKMGCLN